MDLPARRRLTLGFALAAVLALLGWWAMRPKQVPEAPTSAPQSAVSLPAPGVPESPANPEPANVAPRSATGSSAPDETPSTAALGAFRGHVIDAAARVPVHAFEVRFVGARSLESGQKPPGSRKFETTDGRFEWEGLPPGDWTVNITAPGFQRFELADLRIVKGVATPEIVLPLLRGHEVRGRVLDESSGNGIAGASIGFRVAGTDRFDGDWRKRSRASSSKDGTFVLGGLPAGRMTLDVSAQNYAGLELDVVVGGQTSPVDIALSTGGAIIGRLTAADGVTPVAGYAGLWDVDDQFGGKSWIENGEFRFEHLGPGPYHVTGQIEGREAVSREFVLAKNQRIEGVILALVDGRTIRGTVTGLRPGDLAQTRVRSQRDGQEGSSASAGVDAQGAYELGGVQAGRVVIVADAPGRTISKSVDMPADADMTVHLEFPAGVRLSGRVTRGGQPLAGASVTPRPAVKSAVYTSGTRASSDGTYAFENLAPGEYRLWVEDYMTATVQVSRDTVFDIDVPLPQFTGIVLEAEGRVPVVGTHIQLWPAEPGSSARRLDAGSDHFGRFSLAGLEPGDYMMAAHKPGYEMYRKRISYSSPSEDMTIRLRQDAGVEIRVRATAAGEPLREVRVVEVVGKRWGSWVRLQLDDDGKGRIPAALAGSTLSFHAPGYADHLVRGWSGQSLDVQLVRQNAQ